MQKYKEKIFYQLLLAILVIIIAIFAYKTFDKNKAAPQAIPSGENLAVKTVPIEPQDVTISRTFIGYVTPINHVNIVPFINGYVKNIKAKSGSDSDAGEELLSIVPDEYIARYDAAVAAFTKAKASYINAKTYYARILKAGEKAVSKTEMDNAKASFLEAKAGLATAKADIVLAEVNLGYTKIKSPINGTNGYIDLSVGDYISPGKTLFSIIQYDPIRVVFSISDKDYLEEKHSSNLFENEAIKLKLADDSIYEYSGKFAFSDNQTDKATNSIAMYADFPNPQKILTANSYVDVIIEKPFKHVVLMDKKMLLMQQDGNFVYIARGDKAVLKPVTILAETESEYVLSDDFEKNDALIVSNLQNLSPDLAISEKK